MFHPLGSTSATCSGWQSPRWKDLHTSTVTAPSARPRYIQDRFAGPTGCGQAQKGQMIRWKIPLKMAIIDEILTICSPQTGSKKSPILSKIPLATHENIYTVPNILTFSRLVAAPLVGYFLVHDQHAAALSLFVYAGLTDLVDGYIARRYNLQTVVGTIIDPMADKLLMTVGVACLAVNGSIPVWLAVIILGRDVGLALSAIYYRWISLPPPKTMARYWDFSLPSAEVKPTGISKVNTALQLVLVGAAIALPVIPEAVLDAWNLREGMTALQYLVAATTIWSGLSYVFSKDAVKILTKEEIQKRIARSSGKKSS
ncbi:hypothetical protein CDV55_103768 [Aspergillus turcosus]|nr:hypothetical protein CDV55_103768 [Aspergillus turcosus]